MSEEGRRLGMAMAEMNRGGITRARVVLRGEVSGNSAVEIADEANRVAYDFFGGVTYDVDVDVEKNPDATGSPTNKAPKYIGTFFARTA